MHKRTKALAISAQTKRIVYERDGGLCIFCGRPGDPVAHVLRRSRGGLGVPENIVTACAACHREFDEGRRSAEMMQTAIAYMENLYPGWSREKVTYKKGF